MSVAVSQNSSLICMLVFLNPSRAPLAHLLHLDVHLAILVNEAEHVVQHRLLARCVLALQVQVEAAVPQELSQAHVLVRVVTDPLDLRGAALHVVGQPNARDQNALVVKR